MDENRAPAGLLIAALGAAVLAVSVFLPWYGVTITQTGTATAQQELAAVAHHYGNSAFEAQASRLGAQFSLLAGRQLATVTAHETLKHVSLILTVLAGIALLASLLRLADTRGLLWATGSQITLLGTLAAIVIGFRMIVRPDTPLNFISLSLTWGVWLAFASAAAIIAGGLIAGSSGTHMRARAKHGPGPPPLGRVLN